MPPSSLVHPTVYLDLNLRTMIFQLLLSMMRRSTLKSKQCPLLGLRYWCVLQSDEAGLPRVYFPARMHDLWDKITPKKELAAPGCAGRPSRSRGLYYYIVEACA